MFVFHLKKKKKKDQDASVLSGCISHGLAHFCKGQIVNIADLQIAQLSYNFSALAWLCPVKFSLL